MKLYFSLLSQLAFVAALASSPALAENRGVAAALGLKDSAVADAVESGAGQVWNKAEKEKDPTFRTMNQETSLFLQNAPRREPAAQIQQPKEKRGFAAEQRRNEVEKERDFALQQLEFRRSVEDAMKQILSFSPAIRAGAERAEPQRPVQVATDTQVSGADPEPLSARDRLLQSASGGNSPFRGVSIPNEFQGEGVRVESVQIDQRITGPAALPFESSAEDDEGKPVRVSLTGTNGADFPVIDLRQGSRRRPLPPPPAFSSPFNQQLAFPDGGGASFAPGLGHR